MPNPIKLYPIKGGNFGTVTLKDNGKPPVATFHPAAYTWMAPDKDIITHERAWDEQTSAVSVSVPHFFSIASLPGQPVVLSVLNTGWGWVEPLGLTPDVRAEESRLER